MTDTNTIADVDEITGIIRGTLDLYIHPAPELLPRRIGVVELAEQMKGEGFAGAMLWNQFSATAEMATIVTGVTGFRLYGSLVLNGTAGGVNPRVVEHSIRMGAKYISMPTLSGSAGFSAELMKFTGYADSAKNIAGRVDVTDDGGALLPEVEEILDLVASYDVTLGLGYLVPDETMAVFEAARDRGVKRIAVLRPLVGYGLPAEQLAAVMEHPGAMVQVPSSSLRLRSPEAGRLAEHADVLVGDNPNAPAFADAMKRYGAERCVLTSDTGWNGMTALQWLQAGCQTLLGLGLTADQLHTMLHDSPARLIDVNERGSDSE